MSSTPLSPPGPDERRELAGSARSSLLVMACTLLSRLLGFVRIAAITWVFGAGSKADIINLTFSIPNNLRKLLAEGALSSAFVPELSRSLHRDPSGKSAGSLVRSILTFQLIVIVPLCLIAIVFARPLITHVLSEFTDPSQIADATRLFRLFINYLLLISLSAVFMGVLNAHHRFFIPAVAPVLFSIAVIASIFLGSGSLDINAVAIGVLAGGAMQMLVQLPLFRRLGYRLRPRLFFRDPAFRRVVRMWLPVLATSSLFTVTFQVAMRFASGVGAGSVTALSIAITFYQLPFGIFSASVTTVLFPRMSRQVAEHDTPGLIGSLQYGLRFLAVLLVPSTLYLCIESRGLVAVGFQRGEFAFEHTVETARVLVAYAVGLFSVGAYTFMQRVFYARSRYATPFYASLLVAILDVGLSLWLKETRLGTAGIALANSIAFSVGFVLLYVLARSELGRIGGRSMALTALKTLAGVAFGGSVALAPRIFTGAWWVDGSSGSSVAMIALETLLFCGGVLAVYRLTRVEMVSMLRIPRRR